VAYDVDEGTGWPTYNNITIATGGFATSSKLGFKLEDGADVVRELHISGDLTLGSGSYDTSKFYMGGSFGGETIEAGDNLGLVFESAGAGINGGSGRTSIFIEGTSTANRNVSIRGADTSSYGQINFSGGRDDSYGSGSLIKNAELENLSKVYISGGGNGTDIAIEGSYLHDFAAGSYGINTGGIKTIDGNVIEDIDNGIQGLPATLSNNQITRSARGGTGISLPSYPGSGQTVSGNTLSGFNKAFDSNLRLHSVTFRNNHWDDNSVGVEWTSSHNTCSFNSEGDVFGATTPNASYDLHISNNNKDSYHNFDGSVLASDADPLSEFYFQHNNSYKTYAAWRDFDGVAGDYRVWSSDNGLLLSDMAYAPRATDTLTLENESAYSGNTPTTLTLDGELEVEGVALDAGTTLQGKGYELIVGSGGVSGAGTIDLDNGGLSLGTVGTATLDSATLSGSGALTKTRTGTLVLGSDYTVSTIVDEGTLRISEGVTISGNAAVHDGAILEGKGSLIGDLDVASGGAVSPGLSPGQLDVTGAVTFDPGSVLEMELMGPNGGEYDVLNIDGDLVLNGGTLNVTTPGTYTPAIGDTFQLLHWTGNRSGEFEDVILPSLGSDDLRWLTNDLYSNGGISVTPEPGAALLLLCGVLGLLLRRGRSR
jgi:hypothetical protein